jgi:Mannosyl-glycoprotein endo-beta-N-acetylglucosaminidase/N-acetylmuramoyl-L-alanine amidase
MATKRRILVQAGHMIPLEPGFEGQTGADGEAALVKRIRNRLVEILQQDDRFEPMPMPGKIPDGTRADAAVFLHADGVDDPRPSGFSFGFPDPPVNKKLADLIADEFLKIPGHLQRRPHDNVTADAHRYYGFRLVESAGPETLVEHGFMSNPNDRKWLEKHVPQLARAEYNAICRFFGLRPAEGNGRTPAAAGAAEALTTTSTLMAPPRATQAQLRAHLIAHHKAHHSPSVYKDSAMSHIVRLYFTTAKSIGLDPLIAVAQMDLETGHLTSKASQPPQRNPAGIGITGAPGEGLSFPNWTKAVRAHVGRLAAYAIPKGKGTPEQKALITAALNVRPLPDAKRGSAARLQGLSKNWAEDPNYADKIVRIAKEIQG